MMAVACTSCKKSMQIDETEANTEWECPTCGSAFLVQGTTAGGLEVSVTQAATKNAVASSAPPMEPEIKDEAYVYAVESLAKGNKPREIRKSLLEAGYSARQADQIIQGAIRFKKDHETKEKMMPGRGGNSGNRNMMIGGVICLIGIFATLATLSLATQAGGGRYVIAWGAVVFGGIQFFRGWMQSKHS
jgi:predicted RNA-binding Zn-ribbon protein involved in translation (DUF1610 family)